MFKGYIGNTDARWFEFLRGISSEPGGATPHVLEEVNFWKPSARAFKVIEPGAPYFFRLKAPHRRIGGFGIFARYVELPDWMAWDAFGKANGAARRQDFVALLDQYRGTDDAGALEGAGVRTVGCTLLTEAVFFPDELHILEPKGWANEIVSGKSIDLAAGEGLRIWTTALTASRAVQARVAALLPRGRENLPPLLSAAEPSERFGPPRLVAPRLGQGTFRVAVMEAYERACAVTTEHSLPVLQAAHIKPYAEGGPHETANGLFLRSDLHALFDLGYLTVSNDHRLELSRRLREDYGNGRAYEALHGKLIQLPHRFEDRP
ncbi:MAG: HNH endonuclease, partial [Deltaproteobacteria bacterium]|nr:HNH endonuclease [Deltaproteobacteria bacterium]